MLDVEGEMESIPLPGYGAGTAWFKGYDHNIDSSPLDEHQIQQTLLALQCGFTHLDLAEVYGNDREIHEALSRYYNSQNGQIQRSNLWITSKVFQHLENPIQGCQQILERLNCQYLDLLLLHCPLQFKNNNTRTILEVWKDMESLVDQGLVRYIGISNFRIQDIEELMMIARIPPYINQIEFNPYLQQPELQQKCLEYGIKLSAYSPLGPLNLWPGGPLDPLLDELTIKYNQSKSAILLKYTYQKGYIPITTTSKIERMKEYLSVFPSSTSTDTTTDTIHFNLTNEDIFRIDEEGKKLFKRKYWSLNYGDSQG